MVHYKNIFFNLSNGLNILDVSKIKNPDADSDVLVLARTLLSSTPITGYNLRKYYYFSNYLISPEIIRYLLNRNGVMAYRHYSRYQIFGGDRRDVIRVPLWYLDIQPVAADFIDKIAAAQSTWTNVENFDIVQYLNKVKKCMRQGGY